MPQQRDESGEARQDRIQGEQHTPAQNKGYDDAVSGGRDAVPAAENELEAEGLPVPPEESREQEMAKIDDRAERGAQADVRRRERSAG